MKPHHFASLLRGRRGLHGHTSRVCLTPVRCRGNEAGRPSLGQILGVCPQTEAPTFTVALFISCLCALLPHGLSSVCRVFPATQAGHKKRAARDPRLPSGRERLPLVQARLCRGATLPGLYGPPHSCPAPAPAHSLSFFLGVIPTLAPARAFFSALLRTHILGSSPDSGS